MARFSKIGSGNFREEPVFVGNDTYNKDLFLIPRHYINDISNVMIPSGMVVNRIEKLAKDIAEYYQGKELHIICVLKGSHIFFAKLFEALNNYYKYTNNSTNPPIVEHFVRLKSYEGMESTGEIQVLVGGSMSEVKGKDVLIIEDIIDTGATLTKFSEHLRGLDCKTIATAALVEKRTERSNGFKGDFVGFSIPDEFIIGFGMDYNEYFRDLEHICVINSAGIKRFSPENIPNLHTVSE